MWESRLYVVGEKKRAEAARLKALHNREIMTLKREASDILKGQGHTAGVRRLRQTMIRLTKGEMAMRLMTWQRTMLRWLNLRPR